MAVVPDMAASTHDAHACCTASQQQQLLLPRTGPRRRQHQLLLLLLLAAAVCSLLPPQVAAGPCSSNVVTIQVTRLRDLYARLKYPPTSTVKLVLQRNLWLTSTIKFFDGFSCTILTSANPAAPRVVGYAKYGAFPLFQASNVSNLLITKVAFTTGYNHVLCAPKLLGPDTAFGIDPLPCPAILLYRAWGVTLSHLSLSGRVDAFRVTQSRIQACAFKIKPDSIAGLRIGASGDGPNLIKSQILVENNKFKGGAEGILLFRGAVGVTIKNNDFRNHHFTAIQCGSGTSNVGDCMLNSYIQNYVEFEKGYAPLLDSSGFYFDTHWVNPGNYLSCNYVIRGRHCLYMDYTSSGIVVEGQVCAHNLDGVKTNAGHNNMVTSVITINQTECAGWFSCQNYDVNNCLVHPGSTWENKRKLLYDSPAFRQDYPWLHTLCQQTSARGVRCNTLPIATVANSGGCSGIPTDNVIKLSIVDSRRKAPWHEPSYRHCENFPNIAKLNTLSYRYYYTAQNTLRPGQVSPPWDNVGFIDRPGNDFGLTAASAIRKQYAGFRSCPKSAVGVKQVPDAAAYKYFNAWRTVKLSY